VALAKVCPAGDHMRQLVSDFIQDTQSTGSQLPTHPTLELSAHFH